jgi:septal ring factor EnvC (AmiA/AmiB activator)
VTPLLRNMSADITRQTRIHFRGEMEAKITTQSQVVEAHLQNQAALEGLLRSAERDAAGGNRADAAGLVRMQRRYNAQVERTAREKQALFELEQLKDQYGQA